MKSIKRQVTPPDLHLLEFTRLILNWFALYKFYIFYFLGLDDNHLTYATCFNKSWIRKLIAIDGFVHSLGNTKSSFEHPVQTSIIK